MIHDSVVIQSAVPQSASRRTRTHYLAFSAFIAVSVGLWWGSLAAALKLALSSDAYTYILLILPLSLALIYFERKNARGRSLSKAWAGWILMSVALTVRVVAIWDVQTALAGLSSQMFGLILWWIGSVIACLRLQTFRAFLFPLCFLLLMIPVPQRELDWITEFLQYQSAAATATLFRITRVPVVREGIMLSIPDLDIEVARECSSIRSSTMLFVTTLLLAHLFLRTWWRKTLLVVMAVPLSIAKNAVRIFTIAELGTRVDPSYLNGKLHHNGGFIFLGLALIFDVILVWLLRKGELQTPGSFSSD